MNVDLIVVPWDSGHREARMGKGPVALADPIASALGGARHRVARHRVDSQRPFVTEAAAAFELASRIQEHVARARETGSFPLVLSGNCASSLGTVSALGGLKTAVLWFDAHADFNTPETTPSAFFDGMSLATLVGRCWTTMARQIPGWHPVPEGHVVLTGARHLDEAERHALEGSNVVRAMVDSRDGHAAIHTMRAALDGIQSTVTGAHVHIDLDVLDPSVGRANQYATDGGLTIEGLVHAIDVIREHVPIHAAAFTAYDPSVDPEGRIVRAASEVARHLVA